MKNAKNSFTGDFRKHCMRALYRSVAPLIWCKSRTLALSLELVLLRHFISEPTRGSPSATESSNSRSNIKSFHLLIYLDWTI